MEREIWKDIAGYEGIYQASNAGRIRSLDRVVKLSDGKRQYRQGIVLKQRKSTKGYKVVHLSKNGISKNKFVHVLVLESFFERPNGLTQINHKDENKSNNNLNNLEYCDAIYNQNYGSCSKNKSIATINDKKKSKPVVQLSKNGTIIKVYPSLREVERSNGFQHGHIRDACNGKLHTAYGYKWIWKQSSYKMGFDYVGCEVEKLYFDKGNERFEKICNGMLKQSDGSSLQQLSLF